MLELKEFRNKRKIINIFSKIMLDFFAKGVYVSFVVAAVAQW